MRRPDDEASRNDVLQHVPREVPAANVPTERFGTAPVVPIPLEGRLIIDTMYATFSPSFGSEYGRRQSTPDVSHQEQQVRGCAPSMEPPGEHVSMESAFALDLDLAAIFEGIPITQQSMGGFADLDSAR